LFFQSRIGRNFPATSISIGSRSTNEFPRCLGVGFTFPASRSLRKACFRRTRFSLVPGRPMGFRGVRTPDSRFPHQDTPEKRVSGKLDFHWFSVDQWGFEVFGPWIRVPRLEIPQKNVFPANSIFIGSRSTNGVSRCLDPGFVFPASNYPLEQRDASY
jgi:hypothetical protein